MSDNMDKITDELKKSGFLQKNDFDGLLDATKDLTISMVKDHSDCGDKDCSICGMKAAIDGTAYERGVLAGTKLGQKFPDVAFTG